MITLGTHSVDIDSLRFKTSSGSATIPDIRAYDESGEAQAFGASGANSSLTITTTLTSLKDLYDAAYAPRSYATDMHERCIRGLVSGLVTGADVQVFHGSKGSTSLPDWTVAVGERLIAGYVPDEVLSYVNAPEAEPGADATLDLQRVEQQFATARNVGAATVTVKSGAGLLHAVRLPIVPTGTITVYDNTTGSGTVIEQFTSGSAAGVYLFNAAFSVGLTIVSSNAADRWGASYR